MMTIAATGLILVGCGDDADNADAVVELRSSPQFVNRIIPGDRPLGLVQVDAASVGTVKLEVSASLASAVVRAEPSTLQPGDVAEIWMEVPDVDQEIPFRVTVTGRSGSAVDEVTIDATAVPGIDDIRVTAQEIVSVFLEELAEEVPGLPVDVSGLTNGTPVAGLLVVTHYAWFTDEFEIGLAWHIMIAPDDFAELYVRPRDALAPTRAFRLNSWSSALNAEPYTLEEIAAPPEVTR